MLISYFISMDFFMTYAGWVVYIVYIYFMYMAGKQARDEMGGFISFGKALGPIFLTFVVASFIMMLFSFVMYNYIDPSIMTIIEDKVIEGVESNPTLDEDQMEMAIEWGMKMASMNLPAVLLRWAFGLIIPGIIFALILAAIVKKEDKSGV